MSKRPSNFDDWRPEITEWIKAWVAWKGPDRVAEGDIVQETSEALLNDWEELRSLPESYLHGKVCRYAQHVAWNLSRMERRPEKPRKPSPSFPRGTVTDAPSGVEARTDDLVQMYPETTAAVERLPRRQREAITLHYLRDYTIEAAAQMMGIKASAVNVHLKRAKATLRGMLQNPND